MHENAQPQSCTCWPEGPAGPSHGCSTDMAALLSQQACSLPYKVQSICSTARTISLPACYAGGQWPGTRSCPATIWPLSRGLAVLLPTGRIVCRCMCTTRQSTHAHIKCIQYRHKRAVCMLKSSMARQAALLPLQAALRSNSANKPRTLQRKHRPSHNHSVDHLSLQGDL